MKNGHGSNGQNGQGTYQEHVDRADAQYVAEFEAWWRKLPEATRRRLEGNKIKGPLLDMSCTAEREHDAADTPAASYVLHIDLDKLADQFVEKFRLDPETSALLGGFVLTVIEQESVRYKAWLLRRVCGEMLNAKNPKLFAVGLACASNMAGIPSMRSFARKIHVSHEAVSKVKRKCEELLELNNSTYSKDDEARAQYAAVQGSERHWRRQKCTAEALQRLRGNPITATV